MDNAQRSTLRTSITHALLCLTLLLVTPQISSALDRRLGGTGGVNTGEVVVELASVMGGLEWAIDMPWRMEPPYDRLPITVVFHDVADPKDGSNLPGVPALLRPRRRHRVPTGDAGPAAHADLGDEDPGLLVPRGGTLRQVARRLRRSRVSYRPARLAGRGDHARGPSRGRHRRVARDGTRRCVDLAPGDDMVTAAAIVSPLPAKLVSTGNTTCSIPSTCWACRAATMIPRPTTSGTRTPSAFISPSSRCRASDRAGCTATSTTTRRAPTTRASRRTATVAFSRR